MSKIVRNIPDGLEASYADIKLDTISDLVNLTGTPPDIVWVSGYHTKGDGSYGSHIFEWDPNSTEAHNGGTIIELGSTFPNDWSDSAQLDSWFNYSGGSTGRYKLRYDDAVNVKWFGAKGDGVTDDTMAMQKAFSLKNVTSDQDRIYLINDSLEVNNYYVINFNMSKIKLNTPSIPCLKSGLASYNTQISNIVIDCNNLTGTTGFEAINFRHTAYLNNVGIVNAEIGYHAKSLCWDTQYYGVEAAGCTTGFLIEEGSNGCVFHMCMADGCVDGFVIRDGANYPVTNVKIVGGFSQNNSNYGLKDSARATCVDSMYFEKCDTADIMLDNAIFPVINNSYHSGSVGNVCIKSRNTKGAKIHDTVYDGARTNNMYDFDSSNEYCYGSYQRTSTVSVALGITDGLKMFNNLSGTKTLGDVGVKNGNIRGITGVSTSLYVERSLTNGKHIEYTLTGTEFNANLGANVVIKVIADGGADITIVNAEGGQEILLCFKCSSSYVSGNITINGILINMVGAGANKYTYVSFYHSGALAKDVISYNTWV